MKENSSNLFDQFLKTFQDRINTVLVIITTLSAVLTIVFPETTAKIIAAAITLLLLATWGYRFYRFTRSFKLSQKSFAELSRSALRGLLPFEEGDTLFGRDYDVANLTAILTDRDFRYGVLSGESGCGKTSLLRAGIVPQLKKNNAIPVYISSPTKVPSEALRHHLHNEYPLDLIDPNNLLRSLHILSKSEKKKIVVIFDQFEEFFVLNAPAGRASFAKWLKTSFEDRFNLGFLLVVRKDFFLDLHDFYPHIPDVSPAKYTYRLQNFDAELSKEVLIGLARADGFTIRESLAEAIVDGLVADGIIRPAELQIVGSQVVAKRILSVSQFDKYGRSAGILNSYISDAIRDAPDSRIASLILRMLCSENGITRSPRDFTADEILDSLQASGSEDDAFGGKRLVQHVLNYLVSSRILILIKEFKYNLVHDYLAPRIIEATKNDLTPTEQADQLLRKYVALYKDGQPVRIPTKTLRQINKYSSAQLMKDGVAIKLLNQGRSRLVQDVLKGFFAVLLLLSLAVSVAFLYNYTYLSVAEYELKDNQQNPVTVERVVLRRGLAPLQGRLPGMGEMLYETDLELASFSVDGDLPSKTLLQIEGYPAVLDYDPFREYSTWGDQIADSIIASEAKIRWYLWLGRKSDAGQLLNSTEFLEQATNLFGETSIRIGNDTSVSFKQYNGLTVIPLLFPDQINQHAVDFWKDGSKNSPFFNQKLSAIQNLFLLSIVAPEKYTFDEQYIATLLEFTINGSDTEKVDAIRLLASLSAVRAELLPEEFTLILNNNILDEKSSYGLSKLSADTLLFLKSLYPEKIKLKREVIKTLFSKSIAAEDTSVITSLIEFDPSQVGTDWLTALMDLREIQFASSKEMLRWPTDSTILAIVRKRPDLLTRVWGDYLIEEFRSGEDDFLASLSNDVYEDDYFFILDAYALTNQNRPELLLSNSVSPGEYIARADAYYKKWKDSYIFPVPSTPAEQRLDEAKFYIWQLKSVVDSRQLQKLLISEYKKRSQNAVQMDLNSCDPQIEALMIVANAIYVTDVTGETIKFLQDTIRTPGSQCAFHLSNLYSTIYFSQKETLVKLETLWAEQAQALANNNPPSTMAPSGTPPVESGQLLQSSPVANSTPVQISARDFDIEQLRKEMLENPASFFRTYQNIPVDLLEEYSTTLFGKDYVSMNYTELEKTFSIAESIPLELREMFIRDCLNNLQSPYQIERSNSTIICFFTASKNELLKNDLIDGLDVLRKSKNPQTRVTAGRLVEMINISETVTVVQARPENFEIVNVRLSLLSQFSSDPLIRLASNYALSKVDALQSTGQ